MKPSISLLLTVIIVIATGDNVAARPRSVVTFCTWNIEHLAARNGTGCRPRGNDAYIALRSYADTLNADIIAFQEVENLAAAHRVFDPGLYRIEISTRPDTDLGPCREENQNRRMQRTGFAIRNDLLKTHGLSYRRLPDVQALALSPSERWGVHIVLEKSRPGGGLSDDLMGQSLHLLSVHLKSGCAYKPVAYRNDDSPCSRLAAQVTRLEAWMDARAAAGEEFVVLGDFNRQLDQLGDSVWSDLDDSETCEWVRSGSGPWQCREDTAQYSRILDLERARAGKRHPFPRNPRYPYAVDHMVISAGADAMAIETTATFIPDPRRLSDHNPLVMQLDISRGALPAGLRWVRGAAEYRVLARAVYQRATDRVLRISEKRSGNPTPWVVAVDADETILDNSPMTVATARRHEHFTKKAWDAWVIRAEAPAVPGAIDFMRAVLDAGGKIAIITNRPRPSDAPPGHSDPITRATWENLVALGMPDDPTKICLLTRRPSDKLKNINPDEIQRYGYRNNKDRRRRLLSEGKADDCWAGLGQPAERSWQQAHDIVLQVGDNVQDFKGVTQTAAAGEPEAVSRRIGSDFFLLPNPVYGSWRR